MKRSLSPARARALAIRGRYEGGLVRQPPSGNYWRLPYQSSPPFSRPRGHPRGLRPSPAGIRQGYSYGGFGGGHLHVHLIRQSCAQAGHALLRTCYRLVRKASLLQTPVVAGPTTSWSVSQLSSPGASDAAAGNGPAARPPAISAPHPRDHRDRWLRIAPAEAAAPPPPGQPGHGSEAVIRNQPVRTVHGRVEGGYTDMYELICPSCGDHPDLDYSEVSPRLQWLRGPRKLEAALAVFHKHHGTP